MRSIRKSIREKLSKVFLQGSVAFVTLFCGMQSAIADIVPTTNSAATGTTVTETTPGNFSITGGAASNDGSNLFHGFEQFNLDTGELADFVTPSTIDNVITYVTGSPSAIDGVLRVSGSRANLYFINPSGILFGPSARLNLPGHFTAATATSLEFNDQWLHLNSSPAAIDYGILSQQPTALGFYIDSPIINSGDLLVNSDQSLSLFGGTIVNTGDITAGEINLIALESRDLIRINQTGNLVSLEVSAAITPTDISAETLASLITGAPTVTVNALIVNPDNTVSLTSTNTPIPENAGSTIVSGSLQTSSISDSEINVLGRQVAAIQAFLYTGGYSGGGTIRFGGEDPDSSFPYTARYAYIGRDSELRADAVVANDGGNIYVRASDRVQSYGWLASQGGTVRGNGGSVFISGGQALTYNSLVDVDASNGNAGQLTLRTLGIDIENGSPDLPPPVSDIFQPSASYETTLYEQTLEQFENLTLQARHSINIQSLSDDGTLTFQPNGNIAFDVDVDNDNGSGLTTGGDFRMDSEDTLFVPGGNIRITGGDTASKVRIGNVVTESSDPATLSTAGNIDISTSNALEAYRLNAGSRDIYLRANGIDLLGGTDSITADNVYISSAGIGHTINLGEPISMADSLDLYGSDIQSLNGQINRLFIGDPTNSGKISISDEVASSGSTPLNTAVTILGNTSDPTAVSLVGPDSDTDWIITGRNSGNLSGYPDISFSDIANILSDDANNTFTFANENAHIEGRIDGGSGRLTLLGDSIEMPETLRGTGELLIQPQSAGRIVHLGRAEEVANTLSLTANELSGVGAGFSSVEIGRDNSGRMTLSVDGYPESSLTLRSGAEIDAIASSLFADAEGADVSLIAKGDINFGDISTLGGDITIISPRTITTGYLNAIGDNTAGDISVSAGEFFRATNVIDKLSDPSIATGPGGQITIEHGGNGTVPFNIGDSSQNGTVGSISNQTTTWSNESFYSSFVDSSGDLQILTEAPEPPTSPETPDSPEVPDFPQSQLISTLLSAQSLLEENSLEDNNSERIGSLIVASAETEDAEETIARIERTNSEQFEYQLATASDRPSTRIATLSQIQKTLSEVKASLAIQPALLYVYFVPESPSHQSSADQNPSNTPIPQPNDQLEIMLVTADGQPIKHRQWGITRAQVEAVAADLRYQSTSQFSRPHSYLSPGQQLYDWLVRPVQAELVSQDIDNLSFVLDEGLRTIPIAAIHDGQQFLVESYSLGLMPTFSLTQIDTVALGTEISTQQEVLAMGASRFESQPALPAVEAELELINQRHWANETFLNEAFTLDNLRSQVASQKFDVVHLATHANFETENLSDSYIQLWNEQIDLTTLQSLALDKTDIELMILSACNTAMGDRNSEYGFAGFAVSAGSESALASLWPVSDEGTLGFMTQFYERYTTGATRSEALRQAQISMIDGQVSIANGHIKDADNTTLAVIPDMAQSGNWDFSHPFYWSAFTMIGNPW